MSFSPDSAQTACAEGRNRRTPVSGPVFGPCSRERKRLREGRGVEMEQTLNGLEHAGLRTEPRRGRDMPVTDSPVRAHRRADAIGRNLCAL